MFEKMSPQMKEDVTRQAQIDLRNIHYRKIHLMLGMERLLTRKEEMMAKMAKKEDVKVEANAGAQKSEAKEQVFSCMLFKYIMVSKVMMTVVFPYLLLNFPYFGVSLPLLTQITVNTKLVVAKCL